MKEKIVNKVYSAAEINFSINDVAAREEPRKILMAHPEYFDIVDVKNVHMEGNIGSLDKLLAIKQWENLRDTYQLFVAESILEEVYTIDGGEYCEDMVFTANQSFPWILNGEKVAVMSKMRHESRQREVPYFEKFYKSIGYKLLYLEEAQLFEGMGDTIPHYGKKLLYGGYGHRSDTTAYKEIAAMLQVPVVTLELVDDRFYHLDTCFIPVSEETVMLCPVAFSDEGMAALKKLFQNIIEIPVEEAETFFALNAHCINDQKTGKKKAVLHPGTTVTKNELIRNGYEVIEINTSEYMKSGGSVFCMKMMLY
jgi:N-dimethylarginine dimethylaminohydrolase